MIRAEDLARLQPPPRELPAAVAWFVRLAPTQGLMFGVTLSSLLAALVVPHADWQSFLFMRGGSGTMGRVVNAEDRGWREGDKPVHRVHYEFERDGSKESGQSHLVGDRPSIGDAIRVEWPTYFPGITRIKNARSGPLQRGLLLVLFPACFGLVRTWTAWGGASRRLRGMRAGAPHAGSAGPDLIDGETLAPLVKADEIPHGIEVDSDGAWCLPTLSRLNRPALMAVIAAASVGFLASAVLEMVGQLISSRAGS